MGDAAASPTRARAELTAIGTSVRTWPPSWPAMSEIRVKSVVVLGRVEQGLDGLEQGAGGHRLAQMAIGAGLGAGLDVLGLGVGGEHDHGDASAAAGGRFHAPQLANGGEP